MEIREAKISDIEYIQKLHNRLYQYENSFVDLYNLEWSYSQQAYDYFKKRVIDDNGTIVVALVDNQIVGYICGGLGDDRYRSVAKFAELDSLFVDDKYRGQGIGDKLVESFIEWSRKMGAKRIKLEAVHSNESALRFYAKKGFKPTYLELELNLINEK